MLAKREGVTLPTSTAKGDSDRVHIVKKRETLSQIARDHNTTVAELVRVNKLKKADYLIAGKRLLIP
jgi:LysM repeat protein